MQTVADSLTAEKSPEYLVGRPRTFPQQLPANDDGVHHRKDLGAPVIPMWQGTSQRLWAGAGVN
ncbi:hypothetical protein A5789_12345 [Nocardia sp. 852002-51101_SCH5132738]|nr:hypothetical protein A5789_12345 [Nocardia sp. 852002-51101_SCH5132738]OBB54535.1 hypothetical protein A5748_12320 [Nocardia sp. 852002-51244_SCH5132740]OBF82372.1 hypothetical protein A9X06_19360 [Mycobacterium sp. 852002-51759_SCH5129042]